MAADSGSDFFITYSHDDADEVREFDRELRSIFVRRDARGRRRPRELTTVLDERSLVAGGRLDDQILLGLQKASWLIVVLTASSVESTWVNREIEFWCDELGRRDGLIIVRADPGIDLTWDDNAGSFADDADLPPALRRTVRHEQVWIEADLGRPGSRREAALRVVGAITKRSHDEVLADHDRFVQRSVRRKKRARAATAALLTCTVVTVAFTTRTLRSARDARAEADARELSALAAGLVGERPALALAVATEAVERSSMPESVSTLASAHLALTRFPWQHGRNLVGHEDAVIDVSSSPDGSLLATAALDSRVRVWSLDGRTANRTLLDADPRTLFEVEFDPETGLLATATFPDFFTSNPVQLWDARTGENIGGLSAATGSTGYTDLAANPSGPEYAAVTPLGALEVWNPETGLISPIGGPSGNGVRDVRYSDDGSLLVAMRDRSIDLIDASSGAVVRSLLNEGLLTAVSMSPDGLVVATADDARNVTLWDVATGTQLHVLEGRDAPIVDLDLSPDGSILVAASPRGARSDDDGYLRAWDVRTGTFVADAVPQTTGSRTVEFRTDLSLVAGGENGWAQVWDIESDREVVEQDVGNQDTEVRFDQDGAVVTTDGAGHTGSARSGDDHRRAQADPEGRISVGSSTEADAPPSIIEPDSERTVGPMALDHHGRLVAVVKRGAEDPDLISFGDPDIIELWLVPDRGPPTRDRILSDVAWTPESPVIALAFSPDGSTLAAANSDGTVTPFGLAEDETATTLPHHAEPVAAVAFDRAGARLAAANGDGTITLWDLRSHEEIATLTGHRAPVTSLAFAPDGSDLASVDADGTLVVRRLVLTTHAACGFVVDQVSVEHLEAVLGDHAPGACHWRSSYGPA